MLMSVSRNLMHHDSGWFLYYICNPKSLLGLIIESVVLDNYVDVLYVKEF